MSVTILVKKFAFFLFVLILSGQLSPVVCYGPLKKLLNDLFADYDAGIRPYYGEKPVKVGLTAYILAIENIDEENQEFTTSLYLRQSWNDPRLKFNKSAGIGVKGSDDMIVLGPEQANMIWVPDSFIVNEKTSIIHKLTVPNEFVRIGSDGSVLKSQRVTLTASCPMNLQYFPMDEQLCAMEIESFGFTMHDISYFWSKGLADSVGISSDISLPEFKVVGHRLHEHSISLSSGNYSRVALNIHLKRASGKYVNRYYNPLTMFVSVSLLSLWLAKPEIGALICFLNVGFINVFVALSQGGGLKRDVVKSSLDEYVTLCLYYIYASLIVSMLNLYFASNRKSQSQSIIEMQRLGRNHSVSDDTNNLCESQSRIPNIAAVSTFRHYWGILTRVTEVVSRYASWALAALFLLSILIYWVNMSRVTNMGVPDDVILTESYGM